MIKISFATNWWFGTTIISWRSSRSLAASTRGAFKKWSSHYQHSSIHTRNDEARNNIRKSALYDTQWAKCFVKSSNSWKLRGGMGIVSKNQFSVPKISQRFWHKVLASVTILSHFWEYDSCQKFSRPKFSWVRANFAEWQGKFLDLGLFSILVEIVERSNSVYARGLQVIEV